MSLADVSSANIVGYSTLTINKGYSILALNFEKTGSGELSIQDAFPFSEGMTKGPSSSDGDSLMIMKDDGTYDTYFMSNGKNAKATVTGGDGKWVNVKETVVSTATLKTGKAFWYVSKAFNDNAESTPYTITVAGQVLVAPTDSKDISVSYMLIGNPYPCDIPLNDGVVITKGMTKGPSSSDGDSLMIMKDDGTYETYFMSNGKNAKATVTGGDGKWVNVKETVVSTASFPANRAGWFVSKSCETTVQFVNPLAKDSE